MGDFTYEHLFDVVQRERKREELQQLQEDFYAQANGYVSSQTHILRSFDVLSDGAEKVRQQLHNAKKLLKELYDRREKKILLLALNKAKTNSNIIDTSALLPQEHALFEQIVSLLGSARVDCMATPAASPPPPAPKEGVSVRITGDVPKFMGADQTTFGPYKQGDTATLPERIAEILVKKGRAEHA